MPLDREIYIAMIFVEEASARDFYWYMIVRHHMHEAELRLVPVVLHSQAR